MYLGFYGLREKPFNPTPDPKFLFLTPGHREALAQLVYGVRERKGFIALTGEVGTGKTTLVRALLQRLDQTTAIAYLSNAVLDFDGLLEYLLQDLGIAKGQSSRAQRLVALNEFLVERQRAGQSTLLIVDEAQNLAPKTLEEVRLLSNFETPREKLLQILLVGQPELGTKLRLPELQQLKQRIGLRCTVPRLTPGEVHHYIRTRLRIAGTPDLAIFSERAVRAIGEYANGIPRLVNVLCDHCLVLGYAGQTRRIDRDLVAQAIQYLEEGIPHGRSRAPRPSRPGWVAARRWFVAGVAGAALGTVLGLSGGPQTLVDASSGIASSVDRLIEAVRERVAR
jgi:general secretion pathway protein A